MRPGSEAELADCVAGLTGPVAVRCGATRAPDAGDLPVLSAAGLSGITLYEPGALTLVAGAGTPMAEIEETLSAEGQMLAFEPMDHRHLTGRDGVPTIGGAVAVNASGPRRIQAGALRDSLLGVRFVDGQGRVIKNGGRVMKNVTGYDLVKLMAGSHGTLGVLSEVAIKVLPAPDARAVLLFNGLTDAEAVEALCAAMGSPFDVTGAAHLPAGVDGDPVTMIRIEGFEGSVALRAKALAAHLVRFGTPEVERDMGRTAAGWAFVRDLKGFTQADAAVWKISVRPSDGPKVGAALRAAQPDVGIVYDWSGGLVWAEWPDTGDLRVHLAGIPGHATLVRAGRGATGAVPRFAPEPAPVARLSEGLRAKFDPRGLFNPGLMTAHV
ncbi:FAD-binding protein [Oceanomicrobium pacificus]|uniref:FAD-binding protein n=1 Tax=Oceanomicrobium pacificus TaxID=2692916 RepID=A0A6B0TKI1_9RHOB|nr:FAD-binding protein [Oceanomicrobium pacificus]MXU64977.1 FAD-binding protein [Oceanomicrobium pacificus]